MDSSLLYQIYSSVIAQIFKEPKEPSCQLLCFANMFVLFWFTLVAKVMSRSSRASFVDFQWIQGAVFAPMPPVRRSPLYILNHNTLHGMLNLQVITMSILIFLSLVFIET